MKHNLIFSAAIAASCLMASQSSSSAMVIAGAVSNGSFETDGLGSTSATSWTTTSLGSGTTTVEIVASPGVSDGSNAARITLTPGSNPFGAVFSQSQNTADLVTAGMVDGMMYRLSADYTPSVTGGQLVQFGYDAFGFGFSNFQQNYADISTAGVAGVTQNVFVDFTFEPILRNDRYIYQIRAQNFEASDVAFSLDNVQITQIPEPSSTALLGLGAFSLLALRRRR